MCLYPQISQQKLGQIVHVGGVLKTSGPADFKSVPGFENWPRFVGVIEKSKISDSFCQYCIFLTFICWHELWTMYLTIKNKAMINILLVRWTLQFSFKNRHLVVSQEAVRAARAFVASHPPTNTHQDAGGFCLTVIGSLQLLSAPYWCSECFCQLPIGSWCAAPTPPNGTRTSSRRSPKSVVLQLSSS